jgi:hypothetical protein
MMSRRRWCALGAAALLGMSAAAPPAAVLASDYTWDDGFVSNHNWPQEVNWHLNQGYPNAAQDTATFPAVATAWDCDLTTNETILTLTVEDNVDYDGSDKTLTVGELTIDATGVQETDNGIWLTIGNAAIIANPQNP